MPEGDTLHQAATKLGVLEGLTIERVGGTHRVAIARGKRLAGHVVRTVRARGKHLIVAFDHGWSLRTHLEMTGSWHRYRPGERWRKSPGKARVVLESTEWVAVCFAAPTVQIGPNAEIEAAPTMQNAVVQGMDLYSPPSSDPLIVPTRSSTAPMLMNSSAL